MYCCFSSDATFGTSALRGCCCCYFCYSLLFSLVLFVFIRQNVLHATTSQVRAATVSRVWLLPGRAILSHAESCLGFPSCCFLYHFLASMPASTAATVDSVMRSSMTDSDLLSNSDSRSYSTGQASTVRSNATKRWSPSSRASTGSGGTRSPTAESRRSRRSPSAVRTTVTPANNSSAVMKVVTSFRGGVVPEHRGHMPRVGHTAVLYQRDLYVFGGVSSRGQYSSHLLCHAKHSLQWEEIRGLGVVPAGRANHTAILFKNKMMIYGGHRNLEVFSDLFIFDLDTRRWEKIGFEKTQGPGPVFLHTAVYVAATQTMIVLGGFHQREHNQYLGHSFDIRNRVWSGIVGPAAINPQHIQLVAAAYHAPTTSIIVIGLSEADVATHLEPPRPAVHMMNVHSGVWTTVNTTSSPESPIPFRIDIVWQTFLRDFIRMGGFHDDVQHAWYFPLNLDSLERALLNRPMQAAWRAPDGAAGPKRRPQYGFFVLNLIELQWSMVATNFPKKLLVRLDERNRELRTNARIATAALVSGGAGSAALGANPPHVLSASHSRGGGARSSSPSTSSIPLPPITPSASSPLSRSGDSPTVASGRSSASPSNRGKESPALANSPLSTKLKKVMLFSVHGDPHFMRKYAFAAYREPSANNGNPGRSKPMQYLIMHGGLFPDDDYAMLMFSPVVARMDTLTLASLSAEDSTTSIAPTGSQASFLQWFDDDTEVDGNSEGGPLPGMGFAVDMQSDPGSSISPDQGRGDGVDEEEEEDTSTAMLPLIPGARSEANQGRFAVLFHPSTSAQSERLLAYPNCPVAIISTQAEALQWSQRYYQDTRGWLAQRLREAMVEDRKLHSLMKRRTVAGAAAVAAAAGDDVGAADSFLGADGATNGGGGGASGVSGKAGGGRGRGGRSNGRGGGSGSGTGKKGGSAADPPASRLTMSGEAGVTMGSRPSMVSAAALPPVSKTVARELRDFFEAKGLILFDLHELTADPRLAPPTTMSAERSELGSVMSGQSGESVPAGLERLWINVRRRMEQQRMPTAVFQHQQSGGGDGVGDMGSVMAYILLRNALAAIPMDGSVDVPRERARLRWRYLRTLVRTGEAASIVYCANQEETRIRGLPVTSVPGLVINPELHLVGPRRAYKVPTRPIPYALPQPPRQAARSAELTSSGMAVYHGMRHVK